jgi:hydrogenase-4 component F
MVLALLISPLIASLLTLAIRSNKWRPLMLAPVAVIHLVITNLIVWSADPASLTRWLTLDAPGKLVLLIISILFFACAIYSTGYLAVRSDRSNHVFCACLPVFLSLATLVTFAQHLGLMWVALEATALSMAPLIYFNRNPRSIEATWKYLLIGSVGIALALLGSFFLAYASVRGGMDSSLLFNDLLREAPGLSRPWLQAAFVLLLVGYGTKMGLAPMHTWKPDAYGEAPGVVGALLAGISTNCAFLALVRVDHVCRAAGETAFTSRILIFMGLLSMAVAAVFMVGQRDIKRMLAYSSVEQMGILTLALGAGGLAIAGAMLHMINNALAKGVLFLSAGNIHRAYGSKTTDDVRGAMRRLPLSATMLLLGFIAITGSPPFGPFISELMILIGILDARRFAAAGLFLIFLLVIFMAMGRTVLSIVQGHPTAAARAGTYRDGFLTGLPMLLCFGLMLMLGLHIPAPLLRLIQDAAHSLEVKP